MFGAFAGFTGTYLFLLGEDLDIFLYFMDNDEEIQGIFDEKVDEVRSDEFFVQLEIQQL